MEQGPQYISSIRKRVYNILVQYGSVHISSIRKRVYNILVQYGSVHNISVQYGKGSTIHLFNTEKGPQYISSLWKKGSQYISSIRGPQNICSIRERVHNKLVQY